MIILKHKFIWFNFINYKIQFIYLYRYHFLLIKITNKGFWPTNRRLLKRLLFFSEMKKHIWFNIINHNICQHTMKLF